MRKREIILLERLFTQISRVFVCIFVGVPQKCSNRTVNYTYGIKIKKKNVLCRVGCLVVDGLNLDDLTYKNVRLSKHRPSPQQIFNIKNKLKKTNKSIGAKLMKIVR